MRVFTFFKSLHKKAVVIGFILGLSAGFFGIQLLTDSKPHLFPERVYAGECANYSNLPPSDKEVLKDFVDGRLPVTSFVGGDFPDGTRNWRAGSTVDETTCEVIYYSTLSCPPKRFEAVGITCSNKQNGLIKWEHRSYVPGNELICPPHPAGRLVECKPKDNK
jgi:hypothetical protein